MTGVGAGDPGDPAGMSKNPELAELALRYFPGAQTSPAPQRLVRLTRAQLDSTTRALLPKEFSASATVTLPRDPLQTNYEYADNLAFNAANFAPFSSWVADIAARVEASPSSVIACPASGASDACLAEQARKFVSTAFRGTASDATLSRFAELFTQSVRAVGLGAATRELVDVTLTSPRYVFRDEVSSDASGALLPAQKLQHITYTLADASPEALGLSSATPAAYVASSELTRETVEQVLQTPAARDKLMRFFLAWLEVKEPEEFTIAESVFPEFTPAVAAAVVDETRRFLALQLEKAAPRLRDVTEASEGFVSSATAFLFSDDRKTSSGLVAREPAQRLGIFTEPAVIASHSGPTTNRLVKRGVFFVRKVMCMPLGAPPPGLDTSVAESAGKTERERIEAVTAVAPCNGCHAAINPFGVMLENYDAIGRYRTRDESGPIDASLQVDFLDEGPLATTTPVEALRAFTRSPRFQQCFARQLFRFYNGRDETAADDPLLRQMFFDFANQDSQDIVQLLRTLASAASFSQRSEVL